MRKKYGISLCNQDDGWWKTQMSKKTIKVKKTNIYHCTQAKQAQMSATNSYAKKYFVIKHTNLFSFTSCI